MHADTLRNEALGVPRREPAEVLPCGGDVGGAVNGLPPKLIGGDWDWPLAAPPCDTGGEP